MDKKRKETAEKFAQVLREKLTEHFGDMPSAARVANHFNLRAHETGTITTEAARRWIKGLSMPELARFKILSEWLGINTSDFLGSEIVQQKFRQGASVMRLALDSKKQVEFDSTFFTNLDTHPRKSEEQSEQLLHLFHRLNANEKNGILIALWALLHARRNKEMV